MKHSIQSVSTMTVVLAAMLMQAASLHGAILEISIPEHSQNSYCRPSYDNVWRVAAPPFPLDTSSGIGIIIKPTFVAANDDHDFALHQNNSIQPSPIYIAPYVPNPSTVTVTYKFDRPQVVWGVEIIQHVFGVTRIEGFLGSATNSVTSLGSVFGPSGDVVDQFVVPSDGVSQVFSFGSSNLTGAVFQFVVRKTCLDDAFAIHRAYPLDQSGRRIRAATGPPNVTIRVSQVEVCWDSNADKTYQVQYRSELTTNLWTNLGSPIPGSETNDCILDSISRGQPRRFYRTVELP